MLGMMRRNRRPTVLRHLVSALHRDVPPRQPQKSRLPSHHILCAGTYSPVFARLAAEAALAACPPELRRDFRLFIHVDGVASRVRGDLMAWLREIPGVELTYGLFGILSQDRIPGKWHQVMINDIVREFRDEPHLAFIDADLFLVDDAWWNALSGQLADDLYALTVGLRKNSTLTLGSSTFSAIRTNLFSLNTRLHSQLNEQRFNKDGRAAAHLRTEFPNGHLELGNIDTMIGGSLRAQAHGFRVIDVQEQVRHCHIGGFSHLKASKFKDFSNPARLQSIQGLLSQARFLPKVIDYFDHRGWSRLVDAPYRHDVAAMLQYIDSIPELRTLKEALPISAREQIFEEVTHKLESSL